MWIRRTEELHKSAPRLFAARKRHISNIATTKNEITQQGLGWDRVCEAQRSNESPSGAFKRQRGLRQQMEGLCPDKRYPNKITSEMQTHCRSEVPDGQEIFKN